jgi:sarcosine/dimethylglycine N-methyltransferase
MISLPHFTEARIGGAYDTDFDNLLHLWANEPVQHAGYFDRPHDDYRVAVKRTTELLAIEAGIGPDSRVLDVGCGCGDFIAYAVDRFGCQAVGVDLSRRHIGHAYERNRRVGSRNVSFVQASVTKLPLASSSFTHVVSQDALYHVADLRACQRELFRVLEPSGVLAITDFLDPGEQLTPELGVALYGEMLRPAGQSFLNYQRLLVAANFKVTLARDMSSHMRRSYVLLARTARERARTAANAAERRHLLRYTKACINIQAAVGRHQFGWGMFVANRPAEGA